MSLYQDIKNATYLDTAEGVDLTHLAANEGVERPKYTTDDEVLRDLIPHLGRSEKITRQVVEAVVRVYFPASSGVRVFEVEPNVVVVDIPRSASPGASTTTATYMRKTVPNLMAPSTTLLNDANPGDLFIDVASNSYFTSGYVSVDLGVSKENFLVTHTLPSTSTTRIYLKSGSSVRWVHKAGTPVVQTHVVSSATSYNGDFFGVARVEGELDLAVTPGVGLANLKTGHRLPVQGILYFEEEVNSRREKHLCRVNGDLISMVQFPGHHPQVNAVFLYPHAAGSKVTWFDLDSSPTESSTDSTNGNPILLWDEARIHDLKESLDVVTASGVEVRIHRRG